MNDATKDKTTAAVEKPKPQAPAAAVVAGPKPGQQIQEKDGPAFPALSEARFMTSNEYKAPHCWACPDAGTPFSELLKPAYWANIKKLPTNAHIHVDAEDGSYYAELKVLKVGQGFAKVFVLRHVALEDAGADPALVDGYEIQFRGPIVKHRVVRLKDGHVLKDRLDIWDDANAWLRDHKRMLTA